MWLELPRRDDIDCVDNARNIAQNRQDYIQQKSSRTSGFHEHSQRRKKKS